MEFMSTELMAPKIFSSCHVFNTPDFNLLATLESGQVFGFTKEADGGFLGALNQVEVRLRQEENHLLVETEGETVLEEAVRRYFDLDRDLNLVYSHLLSDPRLKPAHKAFKGLRLIRQNPWEAVAGFIVSANNNVKRIQGIWQRLSNSLSENPRIFPSASAIAISNEPALRKIGLGYRAPYLLATARKIADSPERLTQIDQTDYEEAKELLMKYPGVGSKVADCILLYGFHKLEAFPVDVWVSRFMRKFYFRNRKVSEKRIGLFARKRWDSLAGYVQQYLFHAARCQVIKL